MTLEFAQSSHKEALEVGSSRGKSAIGGAFESLLSHQTLKPRASGFTTAGPFFLSLPSGQNHAKPTFWIVLPSMSRAA
jgi:hypothetical protein